MTFHPRRTAHRLIDEVVGSLCRIRSVDSKDLLQLFILGLPRSGTTLVYQYLVHRYHFAYFPNPVGSKPYLARYVTWRSNLGNPPYSSDFKSEFGQSAGIMAPREAGMFWGRFFDYEQYETTNDLHPTDREELRRIVTDTQLIFSGAPFVNKNVKHVLRVEALASIFPNAIFLVLKRDVSEVGLSLLRARRKVNGSSDKWFSVRPQNYKELLNLPPVQQIEGQIKEVSKKLLEDCAQLPASRVVEMEYKSFCANPESLFKVLPASVMATHEKNGPVKSFPIDNKAPMDAEEIDLVSRLKSLNKA